MRGVWTLLKKECGEVFATPLIYLLALPFCLLLGWSFLSSLSVGGLTNKTADGLVLLPLYGGAHVLLLVLAPLLTMRLFSEEKKAHTLELLLSSHLSPWQIVLGKYAAALITLAFLLGLMAIFPLALGLLGHANWSLVLGGHTGIFLAGAAYMAVGLWTSSLAHNQVAAASLSFGLLMALVLLVLAGQNTGNFALAELLRYLSTATHLESFLRGGVRSDSLAYLFSLSAFFLYLTHLSLEARRW